MSRRLTSLVHVCTSPDRCGYQSQRYSTDLAPRIAMSGPSFGVSDPAKDLEASRGGRRRGLRQFPWQFRPYVCTGSTPRRVGRAVYWLSPGRLCALRVRDFLAGADTCSLVQRIMCAEVPHYLQLPRSWGCLSRQALLPAATRIALEVQTTS